MSEIGGAEPAPDPHNDDEIRPVEDPHRAPIHSPWSSRNLLSFDGGGVRGIWSLLVVGDLMDKIGDEEMRYREESEDEIDEEHELYGVHSFYPEKWPENIDSGPLDVEEENERKSATPGDKYAKCMALKASRRYLPCHYFDYIIGTSTGALIAIMLGRFRMTVADCLHEYEQMAGRVFRRPRLFSELRTGIIKRARYSGKDLENVLQEVVARRCEHRRNSGGDPATFHVKYWDELCRTCVTTLRYDNPAAQEELRLLRSYDHINRPPPRRNSSRGDNGSKINGPFIRTDTARTSRTTMSTGKQTSKSKGITNYSEASTLKIWEIARAATAATFFFDPFKVRSGKDEFTYEDAGFGQYNNPTLPGILEIEGMHGQGSVGIVVSVGTSRKDHVRGRGILSKVRNVVDVATNPEKGHVDARNYLAKDKKDADYFRLNQPNTLEISLDEWKPQSTMEKMKHHFYEWSHKNQDLLINCARELVFRRRERMSHATRWEYFATGAVYRCLENPHQCRDDGTEVREFRSRDRFITHLMGRHGLVREQITPGFLKRCRTTFEYQAPS